MSRETEYIYDFRHKVTSFLDAWEVLKSALDQWEYLDYETVIPANYPEPSEGITAADMVAAANTLTALKTAMDASHGTNLYKMHV
jgi:hypothetical protein